MCLLMPLERLVKILTAYQQVLNFSGRQLVQMPVLQAKNRFVRCEKEVLVSKRYCVYQCISMSKLEESSVVSNWWLMPMIIRNIVKLSDHSLHSTPRINLAEHRARPGASGHLHDLVRNQTSNTQIGRCHKGEGSYRVSI